MRPRCGVFVAAALVALLCPAVAVADQFTDPGARFFTLAPLASTDDVSAIASTRDGTAVYATIDGALVTVSPRGAVRTRRVRSDVSGLAVERRGTVLVSELSSGLIDRVNLTTNRVTTFARLRARDGWRVDEDAGPGLTVLDDGSVVANSEDRFWHVSRDRSIRRLPIRAGSVAATAPLPRRRLAILDGGTLYATSLSGHRRVLARNAQEPLTASGDGGVFVSVPVRTRSGPDGDRMLVRIGADGATTRAVTAAGPDDDYLGTGDGLTSAQVRTLPFVRSGSIAGIKAAVAPDGTLLFVDAAPDRGSGGVGPRVAQLIRPPLAGVRGLVPADSPRPRVALTQDSYGAIGASVVRYFAGTPGTVEVTLRQGRKIVTRAAGDASIAGEGQLALPVAPAPGRYELDLRLTGASGVARTTAVIDTRDRLPLREARRAVRTAYADDDGDEGGIVGTDVGPCLATAPRVAQCPIRFFQVSNLGFDDPSQEGSTLTLTAPDGCATATLRNDGSLRTTPVSTPDNEPNLVVAMTYDAAMRQHVGRRRRLAVTAFSKRTVITARIRVAVRWIDSRRTRRLAVITRTHELARRGAWHPDIGLPAAAVAAVRQGRRATANVTLSTSFTTALGLFTEEIFVPIQLIV